MQHCIPRTLRSRCHACLQAASSISRVQGAGAAPWCRRALLPHDAPPVTHGSLPPPWPGLPAGVLGVQLPSSLGSPMQPSYMVMSSLQLPPGAVMGTPPPQPASPAQQPRPLQYVYHLDHAQVGAGLVKPRSNFGQTLVNAR